MDINAVYPGTFDPITNGHSDIVHRAAPLFDHIVVAVAENPAKKPVLDLEERVRLVKATLSDLDNVTVAAFDGLLVEFARKHGARVILRGLRAVSDFEYEFQLAGMNRRLAPEVETMFLRPAEQFAYISSSLVREVAAHGGDVEDFVHPEVMYALKRMR